MKIRDRIFLIGMILMFGWLFDWLERPAFDIGFWLVGIVFLFEFCEWIDKIAQGK